MTCLNFETEVIVLNLPYALLGLLMYEPKSGYEIKQIFEEVLGCFWFAQQSHIYRELPLMERKGWVNSEKIVQKNKMDKRVYSITDEGKSVFINWLKRFPKARLPRIRDEFILRFYFSSYIPLKDLSLQLGEYLLESKKQLECLKDFELMLEDEKKNFSTNEFYWRSSIRACIKALAAKVDWAEETIAEIEQILSQKHNQA